MGTATKQQNKVPELRFHNFNDSWTETSLGDVCSFTQGTQVPLENQSKEDSGDKLKFLRIENYTQESQDFRYIPMSYSNGNLIDNDDVVVVRYGATAGFMSRGQTGVLANNLFTVRPKETGITKEYLFRYLKRDITYQRLQLEMAGGAMPALSFSMMRPLYFAYPEQEEQQKIADFLGSVDDWLDNLRSQKTTLETYKRGMMQKLFTQQVRFKDENGKYFPEWEEKELGEVFNAVKGSGISKEQLDTDGKNECILYGELYTTYSEQVFEVKSKTNVTKGTLSNVGDLLVPCSTTTTAIDLANVTALNKKDVLLGGDITVLRGKDKVSSVFYAYYLSNHKKRELAKYGQGVTIIHVYYSHFKDMLIDVPSLAEQQKIAYFLTSIDESIESKQQQIAKAEEWKKGLMQKMFV